MPIYEFVCRKCRARFEILVGVLTSDDEEACPRCGSRKVARLPSRVQRARSEDERLDDLADRVERLGEPESYREMRKQVREAGEAMDDSAADEMEEMFEAGEDGDS